MKVKLEYVGEYEHGKVEHLKWVCPQCNAKHIRYSYPFSGLALCINCKEIIALEEGE